MITKVYRQAFGTMVSMLRCDWRPNVLTGWKRAVQIGRASIGVPDYDTYVAHIRAQHPERTPMTYEAFFVERQNARYKGGGGRCC